MSDLETGNVLILSDSEVATVKAALDIASDFWENIILTTSSNSIHDMATAQQAPHNALAKRIEEEIW
jgi:uncharacterized lipoprotein YmbA